MFLHKCFTVLSNIHFLQFSMNFQICHSVFLKLIRLRMILQILFHQAFFGFLALCCGTTCELNALATMSRQMRLKNNRFPFLHHQLYSLQDQKRTCRSLSHFHCFLIHKFFRFLLDSQFYFHQFLLKLFLFYIRIDFQPNPRL